MNIFSFFFVYIYIYLEIVVKIFGGRVLAGVLAVGGSSMGSSWFTGEVPLGVFLIFP